MSTFGFSEFLREGGLLVDPPADDAAFEVARLVFIWNGSDGCNRDVFAGEAVRLRDGIVT